MTLAGLMTRQQLSDDTPARVMFPDYWRINSMVRGEVDGLTDAQLDWESSEWEWSRWSIRKQVSHMASLVFRWLLVRWGDQLFANGKPISDDELQMLNSADHDRRLNDEAYGDIEDILGALDRAIELARGVLKTQTVESMRSMFVERSVTPQWELMARAHPTGVSAPTDGNAPTMTLEATFRHMYYEHLTHLFNIQREKRTQGLITVVKLPNEGYWTIPGWDTSEPGD